MAPKSPSSPSSPGTQSTVEEDYKDAAERFRQIIEAHGPQSAEAAAEADEFRERLAAYVQSLSR